MPTMNVNLTPALADFVESEVGAGEYQSASELVRDALRLLRQEKKHNELKLTLLRQEVARGVAEADAAEFGHRTFDEIADAVLREAP